jgi:transposase
MLSRTFGCVRVVWNRTLAARRARWHAEGKGTGYAETDRALTVMKRDPDLGFLNEVSAVPLQQALRHQQAAFTAFWEKARPVPEVQVPARPPVGHRNPGRIPNEGRHAAPGQDERAAQVRLVVAGDRPGRR